MTNGNRLKRTEAVSFVDEVKLQFENDPRKYERFLDIMRELKKDTIDPSEVVVQIASLFKGYPDLAREFNAFVPPECALDPRGEEKASHILLNKSGEQRGRRGW